MTRVFAGVQRTEGGGIPCIPFLDACDHIDAVYSMLFAGVVAGQLKGDIGNSIKTVRDVLESESSAAETTLQQLVTTEILHKTLEVVRKDKSTATVGLLWIIRAVTFLLVLLSKLAEGPHRIPSKCAEETYAEVLRMYHGSSCYAATSDAHAACTSENAGDCLCRCFRWAGCVTGWLLSKVVGTAMSLCPQRAEMLSKFGITEQQVGLPAVPLLSAYRRFEIGATVCANIATCCSLRFKRPYSFVRSSPSSTTFWPFWRPTTLIFLTKCSSRCASRIYCVRFST